MFEILSLPVTKVGVVSKFSQGNIPYQTQNMVKIWKKQVPDMAHIWKIAGGIQSKYGFNNKALSLSFV